MNRIQNEITRFLHFKSRYGLEHVDDYGFCIGSSKSTDKIDLLITGLTHGNEVGGLEIINKTLMRLVDYRLSIRVCFLLGNVEAANNDVRFIERDLNRSFLSSSQQLLEEKRAAEISKIISNTNLLIDLHQTIEPTIKPFFIFPTNEKIIRLASKLIPDFPIVTFPKEGFSTDGKTMMEFAKTVNCEAFAIECGVKGFHEDLSHEISQVLSNLILNFNTDVDITTSCEYIEIFKTIDKLGDDYLIEGFKCHQKLKAGDLIGYRENKDTILAQEDCYLYFPKYGANLKSSSSLCHLGILKKIEK